MRADAAHDVLMDVLNCYKVQEQCDAIRDALDDERRQTQRRMIAALYWRAGAIRLACHTHPYASPMWWGSIADSDAILAEAVRMEAACAR